MELIILIILISSTVLHSRLLGVKSILLSGVFKLIIHNILLIIPLWLLERLTAPANGNLLFLQQTTTFEDFRGEHLYIFGFTSLLVCVLPMEVTWLQRIWHAIACFGQRFLRRL